VRLLVRNNAQNPVKGQWARTPDRRQSEDCFPT